MQNKFYHHVPHCFVCGSENLRGLQLKFKKEGETVEASLSTNRGFEGPKGLVHGGFISLLIDEAAAVLASSICGGAIITAKLEVVFKSPAAVGETLLVRARPLRKGSRVFVARATVSLDDGTMIAEGKAILFRQPADYFIRG